MGNIKNYIRKKIKNLHDQNERLQTRFDDENHEAKLTKLLDKFIDKEITYEQYINLATDYQMAYMFGDGWFFDELDKREDENIEEQEYYEKLSTGDIQELRPIDIARLSKDYIKKEGMFREKT
jgi:hypothetical protein